MAYTHSLTHYSLFTHSLTHAHTHCTLTHHYIPMYIGTIDTSFIASNPHLLEKDSVWDARGMKILNYVANITVNGPPPSLGAAPGVRCSKIDPIVPNLHAAPYNLPAGHERPELHDKGRLVSTKWRQTYMHMSLTCYIPLSVSMSMSLICVSIWLWLIHVSDWLWTSMS